MQTNKAIDIDGHCGECCCSVFRKSSSGLILRPRLARLFSLNTIQTHTSMPGTESVSHDDLIVCTCGSQEYTLRDAIEAALFRGELDSTWKEFLRCVQAEKRAD